MKHKGVIFDMDGLLFDTEKLFQQTWNEIAEERGIRLLEGFVQEISGTNGERMCRIIEKYYQVADGSLVMKDCMERMRQKLLQDVPKMTGVDEILQYFQEKGLVMAVASSSEKQQIEWNLYKSGIQSYFQAVVSGKEVEHGKPSPDIFLLAAEKIGCKAEECFVFEDSENGIRAGKSAGCTTIMIPDLMKPSEEIRKLCDGIYPTLADAKMGIEL